MVLGHASFFTIFQAIGRTFLPPYWSLGFQLSRWGYNKIETVKGLVDNMRKHDLPQVCYYPLCFHRNVGLRRVGKCLPESPDVGEFLRENRVVEFCRLACDLIRLLYKKKFSQNV